MNNSLVERFSHAVTDSPHGPCEGEITLSGPSGSRTVGAGNFFTGPLSTLRQPDEIITALHLAKWPNGRHWAFRKYARREGDFALAGILLFYDEDRQGAASNAHVGVIGALQVAAVIGGWLARTVPAR